MKYQTRMVEQPTIKGIRAVIPDYETMLVAILDAILERFENNPEYPFINTKLSIFTGDDFPESDDPETDFQGRTAVFGMIQGRGLEALAGHAEWLPECSVLSAPEKRELIARIRRMAEAVMNKMETLRALNGGCVPFLMTPDGRPFIRDAAGRRQYINIAGKPAGGPDMFYSKGLFAAARFLGDKVVESIAAGYFRAVAANIEKGTTRSGDGVSFDPGNQPRASRFTSQPASRPGGKSHGGRMIGVSGFALLAEKLRQEEWFEGGARFAAYPLERHVNHGRAPELQPFDFYEFADAEGRPWREDDGKIICDPGHSLEYVGLAGKFLLVLAAKESLAPAQKKLLERASATLPEVLAQSFRNGWNPDAGGICKTFDLVGRKPINGDMPWWNLPETMRAAAEMLVLAPDHERRGEILRIIAECSNAFVRGYVVPEVRLMAYQTRDASGKPVDVIPATPDLDPGYHTGLSVIDFIRCVRRL